MRTSLLVATTMLSFAALYAPQALLPLFAASYDVTAGRAALLITGALLPLSVAPLSYGYLLESVSAVRVLRGAVLLLAAAVAAFAGMGALAPGDYFAALIGLRCVQGLAFPAVFTALMTVVSASAEGARKVWLLSVYVASTIAGGFAGRLLAGASAAVGPWWVFFAVLAVALAGCYGALHAVEDRGRLDAARPSPRILWRVLRDGGHALIYGSVFCLYFVFVGLLNAMPFRVEALREAPSEGVIGLMYAGYLLGIATALGSERIAQRVGGPVRVMLGGFVCLLTALALMASAHLWVLFAALVLFCGVAFLVVTTAVGLINRETGGAEGVVNGLYVSFYYTGGVLGSYGAGALYERFGWLWLLSLSAVIAAVGLLAVGAHARLRRIRKSSM